MTIKTKLATAIATGAVLLNALAPMTLADYNLTISGNGTGADSDVNVKTDNTVDVDQSNDAYIDNNIDVDANTGDNSASGNVGGSEKITTGDATTNVTVQTAANINQATVDTCCVKDVTATISGNGPDSDSDIKLDFKNKVDLDQNNDAYINNDVDVDAETGDNEANDNVGGNVKITTGSTSSTVNVLTAANANSATIGGGDDSKGGSVSAWITGNGKDTDNKIDLKFNNDVDVDQDNKAKIHNDVDVDGDTGDNEAEDNVGGDVEIVTGDANATVEVDTLINFNDADVDSCACLEDVEAKIAGNGPDSDNDIKFEPKSKTDLDQDNYGKVKNDVDVDGDTGDNEANDNVGPAGSDPTVETGSSDSDVTAKTAANANVFGDFAFDFDLEAILSDFFGL